MVNYELLKLKASRSPKTGQEAPEPQASEEPEGGDDLTPQQREWANKAIERYAKAQVKKWRRWNERMFDKGG